MMFCVALSDVLNQRTIVWEEIRGDVDCLCMPDLAVFETVFLWAEGREESELRSDTKV